MTEMQVSTIPNMSQAIKEIVTTKKKVSSSLKHEYEAAIEFFTIITSSDFDTMLKSLSTTGYMHLFKIMTTLEIAIIREENQSNKITYEDALQRLIPIPLYTGNLHEMIKVANTSKMSYFVDLSKIKLNKDMKMEETYMVHYNKANTDSEFVRDNCLINHINLTLLSIIKSYETLKKL